MFIDVDCYEELYLKDKSEDVLRREITRMRSELQRMKRKMESPVYASDDYRRYPSELKNISVCRAYLQRALEYASKMEMGVEVLTEEERAAMLVNSWNSMIVGVSLTVGRHFEYGYYAVVNDDSISLTKTKRDCEDEVSVLTRAEFFGAMNELYLGEWRDSYTPEQYGCTLNEPNKWHLRIDYSDGIAPRFYEGEGVYPYNFDILCKLLNAEK